MEEYMFFAENLLGWIETDIKNKYQIKKPVFQVNNHPEFGNDENTIIKWINRCIYCIYGRNKWVKYKKIGKNLFELKEYFPDPPDKVCKKIIRDLFILLRKQRGTKPIFFKIYENIYNEIESRRELMFHLRTGYSDLSITFENEEKNKIIYSVDFTEEEAAHTFASGFLQLEQK